MYGEYTCPFIHFSGKICGRSCMRKQGCSIHWKYVIKLANKHLTPCSECGRLNRSASGRCPDHIKGFYVSQHYQRLRSRALMNGS
jgi:hypothetical protein